MSYERILHDEINSELNRLQAAGQRWVANWIAQAIVLRHESELTPEADFWRHTGYASVRETVRRVINARAGDKAERAADDRQIPLPGYHHLQAYYLVKRRGKDVGVPIADMSDAELDAKAARYEAMSVACRDHADELREFKKARRAIKRRARGVGGPA